MKVYFLRHGRTEWNAKHRIQGSNEVIDLDDDEIHSISSQAIKTAQYHNEEDMSYAYLREIKKELSK